MGSVTVMPDTHADNREYLVVHQTLRFLLDRFVGASERLDPNALADVLPDRWAMFARGLHHHHETEDTKFFPVVVRERPDAKPLVDELERDHEHLVARLDAVDAAIAALTATPTPESRARAHDAVAAVRDELVPHLDREDTELLPIAAASVDGREWKQLGDDALRSIPKQDLPIVAGALDEVVRTLPPEQRPPPPPLPVRLLLAVSWRRRYRTFIAPLGST